MDNDKSVREQIDQICEEICNNYCKWPDKWDEEKEGIPITDGPCEDCPLTRWL